MKKYLINGGNSLFGEIDIESSKNGLLPILSATILTQEECVIHNVPDFLDIKNMVNILIHTGLKCKYDGNTLVINGSNANCNEVGLELTSPLRSSIYTMGAYLGRFKKAKISYPGGCDIGIRPIDLHIKGLEALGVKILDRRGYLTCDGKNLEGSTVHLDFPSVGATENIMLAGVLAKGTTKIYNPAREPEIIDLQNFLNKASEYTWPIFDKVTDEEFSQIYNSLQLLEKIIQED